jgi:biotin synthase
MWLMQQAFMAGANAIFTGERMLTTPCSGWDQDKEMLNRWGLRGQRSFEDQESVDVSPSTAMASEGKRVAQAAAI